MYVVGNIIWGIPITDDIVEVAADRDEELDEEFGGYFHTVYHGGGDGNNGYLGARLATFDACEDFILDDIIVEPTADQKIEVQALFDNLPKDYKDVAPKIGRWIVWASS